MKILVLVLCALIYHCNHSAALYSPQFSGKQPKDEFMDYVNSFMKEDVEASECKKELRILVSNLGSDDMERYYHSFEVFDAWGKIPSGITSGHVLDMGNFMQCVNINFNINSTITTEETNIVGKYCQAKIPVTEMMKPEEFANSQFLTGKDIEDEEANFLNSVPYGVGIGICIPKVCSKKEIEQIIRNALNGTNIEVSNCSTKDTPDFEVIDYVAICTFSLLGLLLVSSTLYELITEQMEIKPKQEYLAFSIISNAQKLFAINLNKNPGTINCLHGIRSLSMCWVIIAHGFLFYLATPILNTKEALFYNLTPMSFVYYTGVISVDTFLFISGFLLASVVMKEMNKTKGRLNIPVMYIHRLFRLLPIVSILMLFTVSLLKFFGSGPLWPLYSSAQRIECIKTWWRTLLFIQNYHNEEICLGQTWYLAVDMQLYILSPIILIPLYKWGKKFIPVLVVLAALPFGCLYATFVHYNYTSVLLTAEDIIRKKFWKSYIVTHLRYTIWIIGIIFGYLMYKLEGKKIKIPKIYSALAWAAVIITVFSVIFGPYNSRQPGYNSTSGEAACYEYFSRVAWGLALAWMIFACQYGYGGLIGDFLSHPAWQILGRLSFCMYLTHLSVLFVMFGNNQTSLYFGDFDGICTFWSTFGLTVSASVILVLCFEAPTIALEKIIFTRQRRPNRRNIDNGSSNLKNESHVKSDSNVKNESSTVQNESCDKNEKPGVV